MHGSAYRVVSPSVQAHCGDPASARNVVDVEAQFQAGGGDFIAPHG